MYCILSYAYETVLKLASEEYTVHPRLLLYYRRMLMNRQEVLTQLAKLCVLSLSFHQIGVLLPTFEDVKQFQSELVTKLDGVPDWVLNLHVKTIRHIETERGVSIRFLHNVHHARGQTFSAFYMSSRLTEEQKSQYVFTLLPAMVHTKPIITFDDT